MSKRSKRNIFGDHGTPLASKPMVSRSGKLPQPAVQQHSVWLSVVICLFLALAVWIVFSQTLNHEFVGFDDDVYVYENPMIVRGLSWDGVIWAFTHKHQLNWHPLTTLSHMLDCQLYGLHPGGHHLTSVLLHIITVILLFLVLRNMTGTLWRSAFVASVFAIHPLRVESVAWVAERKDVLCGLFFMLTLWAYTRYVQKLPLDKNHEARANTTIQLFHLHPATLNYILALAFFMLGLLSKPMLVTLPLVLLLLDYWPLNRIMAHTKPLHFTTPLSRLFLEKLPFLLLSAAFCMITIFAQKNEINSHEHFSLLLRIGNALVAYTAYIGQMLYPAGLATLYPYQTTLPIWKVCVSLLIVLIFSASVLVKWRKQPYLLVGWLWYLGMLVPVIGFMQVGNQARADRYTYLPQIGLYMIVAWGAAQLSMNWRYRRVVMGYAAGVIFVGLLAGAYVQTGYWKNSITLWMHTIACTSGNSIAHYNLGTALNRQGNLPEAIKHFERALQINPDYAEAHYNLGTALNRQGNLPEAIKHFERALQINPDYADAYNNLGAALAKQRKLPEAIEHYERALKIKPDHADAHNNLGAALAGMGKLKEAIEHYERALQIRPDYIDFHFNLGNALSNQKKWSEAITHYNRVLQIQPEHIGAHNNLGFVLDNQGKMSEALPHFQQALNLATVQNNTALAESLRTKLKSYPTDLTQSQKR